MPRRTRKPSPSQSQPPYYIPSQRGTLTTTKALQDMTDQEGRIFLQGLKDRLLQKQQREHAYLNRRAARGVHTPTDDAYEADQRLEAELLALLDELLTGLAQQEGG